MLRAFGILLYNFLLVVPAKVSIDNFFAVDGKSGCNGTRRVQWQPLDTGSCSVAYTIEFRNKTGDITGTVENIIGTSYCTKDYDMAVLVIMWATYEGRKGIKSEWKLFTETPKPATPKTATILPTTRQEGITHFLYVFVRDIIH